MSTIPNRPPAFGAPLAEATLKASPADFVVTELPNWTPTGAGEHDVLLLRKTNANTQWVARQLAQYAGCAVRDVGYAGLKDRHAITTQWFSVHRGQRNIDWQALQIPDVDVLAVHAHSRKLRIGALAGNAFALRLGCHGLDAGALGARLAQLRELGSPNYFGDQRFGRSGANLTLARRMAEGQRLRRSDRSFALSAARAAVFNRVLAERITAGTWCAAEVGDAMILAGSQSFFVLADAAELADADARLASGDVHISGPLWGRGTTPVLGAVAERERAAAAALSECAEAAERGGARMQRRALRVAIRDLAGTLDGETLELEFSLPAGSYATVVIEQLVTVTQ